MPLPDLVKIVRKNISKRQRNAMANGVVCLKGGDIAAEIAPFAKYVEVSELRDWTPDAWYEEKHLIYLPL